VIDIRLVITLIQPSWEMISKRIETAVRKESKE
jgi:hypothetical protein